MRTCVVDHRSPIRLLVARPVVEVQATATIGEASEMMFETGTPALLMGRDGTAVVTDRDLAHAIGAGNGLDTPISEIRVTPVRAVSGDTPIADAAAVMLNDAVDQLVVVDAGTIWIVSLAEVAAVLLQGVEHRIWLAQLQLAVEPSEVWLG